MFPGILPAYESPAEEMPPTYTDVPLVDEQTVAYTPRPGASNQHGNYVKCWNHTTLILRGQDENTRSPTYSRGATINGEVGLSCPENVLDVSVKLYGHMSLMSADCGSAGATLVSDSRLLWNHDWDAGDSNERRCPSILPFSLCFPLTFVAPDGLVWKLPPSFESTYMGIPALLARCVYTLSITIAKTRRYGLASWNTSKTFTVTLNYRPRTRPQRPIVMLDTIFESIKPVPEEWQQLMVTMETRLSSNAKPLECHFLLPSVQTFSISDTIPFHIQLHGSLESLRELVPPGSCLLDPVPANDPGDNRRDSFSLKAQSANAIRVYLARQLHLEVNGKKRFRMFTTGRSRMWPCPPTVTGGGETQSHSGATDDVCLDWQGELKCLEDVTTGSFNVGALSVKDFLVVSLSPINVHSSFLIPVQLTHPIRLVTDSWMESERSHPQDV